MLCYIELGIKLIRMLRTLHYKSLCTKYFKTLAYDYSFDIIKINLIKSHTILIQDIFTKITKGMRTK